MKCPSWKSYLVGVMGVSATLAWLHTGVVGCARDVTTHSDAGSEDSGRAEESTDLGAIVENGPDACGAITATDPIPATGDLDGTALPWSASRYPDFYLGFLKPAGDWAELTVSDHNERIPAVVVKGNIEVLGAFTDGQARPVGWDWKTDAPATLTLASYPRIRIRIDHEPIGDWIDGPPYRTTLDTTTLTDGSHLLGLEWSWPDKPAAALLYRVETPIIVDNVPGPVTGRQKIWMAAAKFELTYKVAQASGNGSVEYPGTPSIRPRPAPFPVRPAVPFRERLTASEMWVQRMTPGMYGGFYRYFVETKAGHIGIWPGSSYDTGVSTLGADIDGPRFVGIGTHWLGGDVGADGTYYVASDKNRIAAIDVTGEVRTIAGRRLKADRLIPYWNDAVKDPAWAETHYETVGTFVDGPASLNKPSDVQLDPNQPGVLYIADTYNHRILKAELRGCSEPAVLTTYAGSRTAAAGHKDGPGDAALFETPWSIAVASDGSLYVSEYLPGRIRRIRPDRSVETVMVTSEPPPTDAQLEGPAAPLRATFVKNGAFDTATLVRPQTIRFDSRGRLLVAERYTYNVRRLDLGARTIATVAELFTGPYQVWHITLSVDREGTFGPVDDLFAVSWQNEYRGQLRADGTYEKAGALGNDRTVGPVYPTSIAVGHGQLWMGAQADMIRVTKRQPNDPTVDVKMYESGQAQWRKYASLTRGYYGANFWGGEQVTELARLSDDALKERLPFWTPELLYFVRWEGLHSGSTGLAP